MLPAETPKLPKWPFLVSDAALLGFAWFVTSQSRAPLSGFPLTVVLICVLAGAVLAAIPFLADYARRQDEALDERQRSLDALSRTVAATAEQIGIAANGLHEIAALAQRNLKAAETLAGAIEKTVGAHPVSPDLERLQAAADKAARAAAELARFETSSQKNFIAASETLARTTAAIEMLNAKVAARTLASTLSPEPSRGMPAISVEPFVPPAAPESTPVTPAAIVAGLVQAAPVAPETPPAEPPAAQMEAVLSADSATPAAEKPKRIRKPREKKAVESAPAPESSDLQSDSGVAVAEAVAVPQVSEVVERVRTSDGATRLIVTAYIGIGNRLFIRGEGPGLNWDSGMPLQFVSIGRWRWESTEAGSPVKFKLYKNDAIECTSLGEQSIDAGQQEEITALF